jgi:hypothetical protein
MNIKKHLVLGALVSSLCGLSSAQAHESNHHWRHPVHAKVFTQVPKAQRTQLQAMLNTTHHHLMPLIKKKRALHLQEMGLMATPGTHWEAISLLVEQSNATNAEITKLVAKSQFDVFNQFGVLLPHHARFIYHKL